MPVEYRVISIGATSHSLPWGEQRPVRTQHATTTLVVDGERRILVDPSLPGEILRAKLFERTGKGPESITDVFCTTLRPDFRRGLSMFEHAAWYAGEVELEWYGRRLEELSEQAERLEDEQAGDLDKELQAVQTFRPAPEKLGEQITVLPLFGPTPGCCGLLLTPATQTVIVAGPAAATAEHIERGMIWEHSTDHEAAAESFRELFELADVVIPGFDNILHLPGRMF